MKILSYFTFDPFLLLLSTVIISPFLSLVPLYVPTDIYNDYDFNQVHWQLTLQPLLLLTLLLSLLFVFEIITDMLGYNSHRSTTVRLSRVMYFTAYALPNLILYCLLYNSHIAPEEYAKLCLACTCYRYINIYATLIARVENVPSYNRSIQSPHNLQWKPLVFYSFQIVYFLLYNYSPLIHSAYSDTPVYFFVLQCIFGFGSMILLASLTIDWVKFLVWEMYWEQVDVSYAVISSTFYQLFMTALFITQFVIDCIQYTEIDNNINIVLDYTSYHLSIQIIAMAFMLYIPAKVARVEINQHR